MADSADRAFFEALARAREEYAIPHRLRGLTQEFGRRAMALMFPHFDSSESPGSPERDWERLDEVIREAISPLLPETGCADIRRKFARDLPHIRESLLSDAQAIHNHDPAAVSRDEVILAYPGFYAIAQHRIAHFFHGCGVPLFPRLLAELAHSETGIDIHPGAKIGRSFSIDHGTGVVIGSTTVIGSRVRIFQGVTLGALSVSKELAEVKRHPTIEDDVVIYANATILGGDTTIGHGSVIGGNVWLTHSVAPNSVVLPASTTTRRSTEADAPLDYHL